MAVFPTVADVLALPVVRQGEPEVVAGQSGLARPVQWAHPAEPADIARLLRGGELVMTTGIALPDDEGGLAKYVVELAEAGAAGLLVELGRRWSDSAPGAMVTACDAVELPLVVLRREVRFVGVVTAVGELVLHAQLAELRAMDQVHRTFTELSAEGADTGRILAAVAYATGRPVVLESIKHQVLAYDAAHQDPQELLTNWATRSRAVPSGPEIIHHPEHGWLTAVVSTRGDDWGRLVLCGAPDPCPLWAVAVSRAATALALHRLERRDHETSERQVHRALLAALTSTAPLDGTLAGRCADAGLPVHGRWLAGVVVVPVAWRGDAPRSLVVEDVVRELAELTAAAARDVGVAALVAAPGAERVDCLISVWSADGEMVDRLAAEIHRRVGGGAVVVAAGAPVQRVELVRQTLAEAHHVASAVGSSELVCHRLSDTHVRGLLRLMHDDERLHAFCRRELQTMTDYDARYGTSLVRSLRALVENRANKAAAAAALGLSRPAYYERLARVEAIARVDLSDPEIVTSLHIALIADDLLEHER